MQIRLLWIVASIGFLFSLPLNAAFEPLPVSARSAAMGQAGAGLSPGVETMDINPAGLADCKATEISLFLSRPFGIKELANQSLSVGLPVFSGGLGIQLRTFGSKLYRENWAVFGFGRKFGNLSAGLQCRLLQLAIERYGSATVWTFDAGLQHPITEEVRIGCAVTNLLRTRLGYQNQSLPQIIRMGIAFQPVGTTTFALDVDKDVRYPAAIRGGLETWPLPSLSLRIGFTQHPNTLACGLGINLSGWHLDYGWTCHSVLGATHLVSLVFQRNPDPLGH